jgi:hypothetical protein
MATEVSGCYRPSSSLPSLHLGSVLWGTRQSLHTSHRVGFAALHPGPADFALSWPFALCHLCAGAHCLATSNDVALAWIPGDVCVAVVLELVLLEGGADPEDHGGSTCTVLAWGALMPFSRVSGDGHALVAEGQKQVGLHCFLRGEFG